jgi:hypothetical protein
MARIRTNSAECRNALAPQQARKEGLPPSRGASSFGQKWLAKHCLGSAVAEIRRAEDCSIDAMRSGGGCRLRDGFIGASASEPRPGKIGRTNLRGHLQRMPSQSTGNPGNQRRIFAGALYHWPAASGSHRCISCLGG